MKRTYALCECGHRSVYWAEAESVMDVVRQCQRCGKEVKTTREKLIAGPLETKGLGRKPKEHKSFPSLSTKVVDADQGIVEHIITVFGVLDHGHDISHPGSFTKTIRERGLKTLVLDSHGTDSVLRVVGKPLGIKEVSRGQLPPEVLAEYPKATGGVWAQTQFLLNTPEGKGVFERIKADALREWSFGYDPLDFDFSTEKGEDGEQEIRARNLRTIRLYEYSPVLWGMNPATAVLDAKEDKQPVPVETVLRCKCPDCGETSEGQSECDERKCPECGASMEDNLGVEPGDGETGGTVALAGDIPAEEAKPAPDVTENTIRIRVRDPKDFQQDSFRTINIGSESNGIQAVIGRLQGEDTTTTQSFIFSREKFTAESAQAWVEDHKEETVEAEIKVINNTVVLPLAVGEGTEPLAKEDTAEVKIGRRFSNATVESIQTTISGIQNFLTELGELIAPPVEEAVEDTETETATAPDKSLDGAADSQPDDQAGTEPEPPTSTLKLLEIEQELLELELLED